MVRFELVNWYGFIIVVFVIIGIIAVTIDWGWLLVFSWIDEISYVIMYLFLFTITINLNIQSSRAVIIMITIVNTLHFHSINNLISLCLIVTLKNRNKSNNEFNNNYIKELITNW